MNAKPQRSAGDRPHVRDFEAKDQPRVRQLIQDGLRSRWGPSFDPTANPDTDDLLAHYVAPGGQITVVEIGGEPVATGILCLEPPPTFVQHLAEGPKMPRLRRISVSGEHRRKGLGRLVVDDLVRRATELGFGRVLVSTDTPWTDAIALYRSCGFTPVHTDTEETHLLRRTAGY